MEAGPSVEDAAPIQLRSGGLASVVVVEVDWGVRWGGGSVTAGFLACAERCPCVREPVAGTPAGTGVWRSGAPSGLEA